MLKTRFWKDAAASLPAHVRARHIGELERAARVARSREMARLARRAFNALRLLFEEGKGLRHA